MTLHTLIDELTQELNLTPEQQFRLTAKIKRLIHYEKASVYGRMVIYSEHLGGEIKDQFVHDIASEKAKQHEEMATALTDEELVTWSVGSHKFVQIKPPCQVCNANLNLDHVSYMHTYNNKDGHGYYCENCARKEGIWDEEDWDGDTV